MSTHNPHEDRAKVMETFGGTRGLVDSGVPSIAFLIAFNISHDLNFSLWVALTLAAVFAFVRIITRETLQHAISGFVGIGICALLSRHTGKAEDFYLPGLWTNVGYGILYTVANIAGWPILGVMFGPILGENFEWRKHPDRKRAYIKAGWLWVALFASRLLVQYPLYRSGNLTALGTARLVMGYPLFILTGWGTWQILKKVPSIKSAEQVETIEEGL
ncbi:MAG: hypothetical protein RL414_652 [Actinomycetota bacterium]